MTIERSLPQLTLLSAPRALAMLALKFASLSLTLVLLSFTTDVFSRPSPRGLLPNSISLFRRPKVSRPAAESSMFAKAQRHALIRKLLGPATPMDASLMTYSQNNDEGYYVSVGLGTPSKSYYVILDTGSADLWVTGQNCTAEACAQLQKFNTKQSSSFKGLESQFKVAYADSNVDGDLGEDTLTVGPFTIQNQIFGSFPNAMDDPDFVAVENPVSGILGLGWEADADSRAIPFWEYLAKSGQWKMPLMSLHLARSSGNSEQDMEPGGTFTLGAYDPALCTGLIYYNYLTVTENPSKWTLPLAGILVDGKLVIAAGDTTIPAVIDSGTVYIYGPRSSIEEIYQAIPGSTPDLDTPGSWLYPCDTNVNIGISFADGVKWWPISATDFLADYVTSTMCRGAFMVTPQEVEALHPWTFGVAFMKNVYTVFKYYPPEIGFAELSATALAGSG
ncbi:acid protease [Leucogyrophana mollusca]|uniref:Acid protease n=1 Tax=Leucogyrophana mollusca TaxID=85980 RepID=A0ACB8BRT7_9AGAM|nr:acid protease [Leucogyrophana mollusca]